MGTQARVGLLLAATACLVALMVDWVIEELHPDNASEGAGPGASSPTGSPSPGAGGPPAPAPTLA